MAMLITTNSGIRASTAGTAESHHMIQVGQQDRTNQALTIATEGLQTTTTTREQTIIALETALHASSNRSSQGHRPASEISSVDEVLQVVDLTGEVAVESAVDLLPIATKKAAHMGTVVTIQQKSTEAVTL